MVVLLNECPEWEQGCSPDHRSGEHLNQSRPGSKGQEQRQDGSSQQEEQEEG